MKLKLAVGALLLSGMSVATGAQAAAGLNLGVLTTAGTNLLDIYGPASNVLVVPILSITSPFSSAVPAQLHPIFALLGDFAPAANPVFTLLGTFAGAATLLPTLPALPGLSE